MSERYEVAEESLGYLTAALAPEPTVFDGRHFRLEPLDIMPRPIGPIRLVVGGVGKTKTPTLAGRYADEYNIYPGEESEMRRRIDVARDATRSAGRDFGRLLLSSGGQVLAAATEAGYRDELSRLAASMELEVADLEAHYKRRNTPRGSYEQAAEQLVMLAGGRGQGHPGIPTRRRRVASSP